MAFSANLIKVILAAVALLLGCAGWSAYELQRPLELAADGVDVRIAAGASVRGIAAQLRAAGVPVRGWEFVLAATVTRSARALRAGRYHFERQTSLLGLLDKFRRGDVVRTQLTVLEGSRFADLRRLVADSADLRHDTANWTEEQVLKSLGAEQTRAEGLFAPDTYTVDPEASDLELYRLAYRAQQERLQRAWETRSPGLPYATPYQALIMASIIEKETGREQERALVAAVFVNRQLRGMALQTDPTIIYEMGDTFSGRLHKRDLQRDSPYNTYTRAGLPPTPISLPGRNAIEAALHPDPSPVLYFVARGDGSSEFSTNLPDHNRAVDHYQRTGAAQRGGP